MYGRSRNLEFTIVDSCLVQTKTHSQIESLARQLLCDVIGHDNQSQHYPDHGYLCLELSGRITTPNGFSYHTGCCALECANVFMLNIIFSSLFNVTVHCETYPVKDLCNLWTAGNARPKDEDTTAEGEGQLYTDNKEQQEQHRCLSQSQAQVTHDLGQTEQRRYPSRGRGRLTAHKGQMAQKSIHHKVKERAIKD